MRWMLRPTPALCELTFHLSCPLFYVADLRFHGVSYRAGVPSDRVDSPPTSFWVSVPQRRLPNQLKLKRRTYLNQVNGEEFLKSHLPAWARETFEDIDGTQQLRFTAELFKAEDVDDEESCCGDADVRPIGDDLGSSQHILGDGNLVIVISEIPRAQPHSEAAAARVAWPENLASSSSSFKGDRGSQMTSSGSLPPFLSPHCSNDSSSSSLRDSGDANSSSSDCSEGQYPPALVTKAPVAIRVSLSQGTIGVLLKATDRLSRGKQVKVLAENPEARVSYSLPSRRDVALAVRMDPLTVPRPLVHLCLPAQSIGTIHNFDFLRHTIGGESFLECHGIHARQKLVVGYPWRVRLADLCGKHTSTPQVQDSTSPVS